MVSGTCPEPSLHVSEVTALGLNKHVVGISVLAEACVCLVLSVWKKDRADDPATSGKIRHNSETYRTNSKEKATLCNYCSSAAIGEDKLVTSSLLVICSIVSYEWNWVCFIYSAQNVKLQFASEDFAVRKMQIKQNTNMVATIKQNHSLFLKQGHLVVSCLHRMVVVVGGGWGVQGWPSSLSQHTPEKDPGAVTLNKNKISISENAIIQFSIFHVQHESCAFVELHRICCILGKCVLMLLLYVCFGNRRKQFHLNWNRNKSLKEQETSLHINRERILFVQTGGLSVLYEAGDCPLWAAMTASRLLGRLAAGICSHCASHRLQQ